MSDKPDASKVLASISSGEAPKLKKVDKPKEGVSDSLKAAFLEDAKEKKAGGST